MECIFHPPRFQAPRIWASSVGCVPLSSHCWYAIFSTRWKAFQHAPAIQPSTRLARPCLYPWWQAIALSARCRSRTPHHAFDEGDLQTLTIIGNQTASALANAYLFRTVQRHAEQLAAIAAVSQAITAELDLDELLRKVVELIRERFGSPRPDLPRGGRGTPRRFRASAGHDLNKLWLKEGRSQRFFEGIIGWVAATGEHVLANDVSQ